MDTFGLNRKMDEAVYKCLSCGAPLPEGRESQKKYTGGRLELTVLGDDGDMSKAMYELADKVAKEYGERAVLQVEKSRVESYHIRKLPALVINGSIVSQGISMTEEDIRESIEYLL